MAKHQPTKFVQSASCPPVLLSSPATQTTTLSFMAKYNGRLSAPLARILPLMGPVGTLLPFARITHATTDNTRIFSNILSDNLQETEASASRRGHSDEWYQERCVFCAECKTSVNSTYQKRGTRCHGCRRWFHNTCMPPENSSSCKSSNQQRNQEGSITAAMATGDPAESRSTGAGGSERHTPGPFFHTDSCRELYNKLAAVAAAGEQQLPVPTQRTLLPWQQQQPPAQQTWQLLDLAEVRHLYKDAQRRGMLHKQLTKVRRQLADFAADGRNSGTAAGMEGEAGNSRHVVRTRLENFLTVCELVRSLGDGPKDLLEDSYALITRTNRGAVLCAGTVNVYGCDHARLQGLATPQHLQHQGHASRLMKQLEAVLQGAGVQQLAVILEPQSTESSSTDGRTPSSTVEHWLRKRLGYHVAGSELCMLWRRELPDYHKNLTAGCTLLVKPLAAKQKGWW